MSSTYPSSSRSRSDKCFSDSESSYRRRSQDFIAIKRGSSRPHIYTPREPKDARHGQVCAPTTPSPRKQCPRSSNTALKKAQKIALLSTSQPFYTSPPSVDRKHLPLSVAPPKYARLPRPHRASSSVSSGGSSEKPSSLKSTTKSSSTDGRFHQNHVSFANPDRPIIAQMHPLLACSRLSRAPIAYDISYTPSSSTIIDRVTHAPIPAYLLLQPATEPPTTGKMVLKVEGVPWDVVAVPVSRTVPSTPAVKGHRSRVAPPSETAITNLDLLFAIHNTMYKRVTREEWEALGSGSSSQRKVARAYEKRCQVDGRGWDEGVRRIDYLKGRTKLVGIEAPSGSGGGMNKIVFKA